MQRQLSSLTRSLVSTPVIWFLPPVLVLRSAGFGFRTLLFHSATHRRHPMWRLTQFSHMLHPGLLVDRLPMRVHVLPPRFVTSVENQATLPVFALRPMLLHPSPRSLMALEVSHHAR